MIAAHERIEIGDHTMFANGCFVGDAEPPLRRPRARRSPGRASPRKGPVRIGANCWFGVNCVVTSGVTIGERCVIGANSVVTRDLPPATIAAGAPAKADPQAMQRRFCGQLLDLDDAEPGHREDRRPGPGRRSPQASSVCAKKP